MPLHSLILAEPQHFSLIEKLLFAALALTSGFLFWRRFGVVLHKSSTLKKILTFASRPSPSASGISFGKLSARPKSFANVLCPASHTPWSSGRFWPSLSSPSITAVGLGIGFLPPESLIGRFDFYIAALFAIACAAGILSLFVRRFLIRPKWLGEKLSWESGVIAGLIFLLMATYLAAFAVADTSPEDRLWWLHTRAFNLLPLIPHTKHLHLILSPATIFLSRGSFAQIPPLAGDEDFGLVAGADLTQLVSLQTYSCVECVPLH